MRGPRLAARPVPEGLDPAATAKCARNLAGRGLTVIPCRTAEEAIQGAGHITTVTADKQYATILTDNMVGAGVHLNAVGGDCPGKTELHRDILLRSDIFVEFPPQTRIEGDIQQMEPDFPVTELWQVLTGSAAGRRTREDITVFDSVGFAIEDFSALRYVAGLLGVGEHAMDLIPEVGDPKDLFGEVVGTRSTTSEATSRHGHPSPAWGGKAKLVSAAN